MPRHRAAAWLAFVILALLPLLTWPGLAQPFSTPKRWALAVTAVAIGALAWRDWAATTDESSGGRALPLIWLASWAVPSLFAEVVSFDALLTAIGAGLWGFAVWAARPTARDMARAAAIGGAGVAAIAIAQWAGHDPFAALGWQPPLAGASVRMRVYSTLGNPNFVAAFLSACVPLTAACVFDTRTRLVRGVAAVILAADLTAIVATGSRAGAAAIVAAAVAWAAVRGRVRLFAIVAALAAAGTIAWLSEGRPVQTTMEGRMFLWSEIAPHAWAHPWVGFGPGGIEAHAVVWQHERQSEDPLRAARFAGSFQHADNDYLEALVERGLPGLIAVLLVMFAPLLHALRHGGAHRDDRYFAAASGAIAALAAVAIVDEPLARPAELMVLFAAIAMLYRPPAGESR